MVDQSSFPISSEWLTDALSPTAAALSVDTTTTTLAPLRPEQRLLLPNHQSARAKALARCARIGHIRIRDTVKIDGHTHYVVQLFYKRTRSNIPTAPPTPLPLEVVETTTPDAEKPVRFSTFANLRHEMYFHASTGHGKHPCAFCASMTSLLRDGPALPRLRTKLFRGNNAVAQALEGFVNDVLTLTNESLSGPEATHRRLCDGQREIPLLLERFLTQDNGDAVANQTQSTVVRRTRKATRASP